MAEWNRSTPERYEETVEPQNPPNAVVEPELRKTPVFAVPGMWYYLGPLGLLLLVTIFALIFWMNRDAATPDQIEPTTAISEPATPGGINPDQRPSSTQQEIDDRGAGR